MRKFKIAFYQWIGSFHPLASFSFYEVLSNNRDAAVIYRKTGEVNIWSSGCGKQDRRYWKFIRFVQEYVIEKYNHLPFPEVYEEINHD